MTHLHEHTAALERALVLRALLHSMGDLAAAAVELGVRDYQLSAIAYYHGIHLDPEVRT